MLLQWYDSSATDTMISANALNNQQLQAASFFIGVYSYAYVHHFWGHMNSSRCFIQGNSHDQENLGSIFIAHFCLEFSDYFFELLIILISCVFVLVRPLLFFA